MQFREEDPKGSGEGGAWGGRGHQPASSPPLRWIGVVSDTVLAEQVTQLLARNGSERELAAIVSDKFLGLTVAAGFVTVARGEVRACVGFHSC